MAWNPPLLREVNCSMEINMYYPADDPIDGYISDHDVKEHAVHAECENVPN